MSKVVEFWWYNFHFWGQIGVEDLLEAIYFHFHFQPPPQILVFGAGFKGKNGSRLLYLEIGL